MGGDVRLGTHRWPEVTGRDGPLLLVPVGATEQHGPGLPMCTDTLVAVQVAEAVARRRTAAGEDVLVAPAVSYGASGEHEDFPGTVSIGHDALRLLLVELGRSAGRWTRGVVFVNGHGGNVPTVAGAVLTLREERRPAAWTACAIEGGDAHAGATETSLLLVLAPALVRTDLLAPGETAPLPELMPRLRTAGVRAVSASGVLGDPTQASPEEGRRILERMVERIDGELAGLDVDERGRLASAPVAT